MLYINYLLGKKVGNKGGQGGKIPKKEKNKKEPGLAVSQADRILHLQVGVGVGWKIRKTKGRPEGT